MKKILLIISSVFCLQTYALNLHEGQETNGGDAYAAEFFVLLDASIARMPLTMILADNQIMDRERISIARQLLKVTSVDSLTLDGREVSAINRPQTSPPSIVLSRTIWQKLTQNQKQQLVLHEVLPIIGVYDKDYQNSARISQQLTNNVTSNYYVLDEAVRSCDESAFSSVTAESLMTMTTPNQRVSLLLESLKTNCSVVAKTYAELKIDMDICIGKYSLLTWYLRQASLGSSAIEILSVLSQSGVPTAKVCNGTMNDVCQPGFFEKIAPSMTKALRATVDCPLTK